MENIDHMFFLNPRKRSATFNPKASDSRKRAQFDTDKNKQLHNERKTAEQQNYKKIYISFWLILQFIYLLQVQHSRKGALQQSHKLPGQRTQRLSVANVMGQVAR